MTEKTHAVPNGVIHYWMNDFQPGRAVLVFLPGNGAGKKGRQFLYHGGQRCLCFNGQLQSLADNRLIITKAE